MALEKCTVRLHLTLLVVTPLHCTTRTSKKQLRLHLAHRWRGVEALGRQRDVVECMSVVAAITDTTKPRMVLGFT